MCVTVMHRVMFVYELSFSNAQWPKCALGNTDYMHVKQTKGSPTI